MQIGPHSNDEFNIDFNIDPFAESNPFNEISEDSLVLYELNSSTLAPVFQNILNKDDIKFHVNEITEILFFRITSSIENNNSLEANELSIEKDLIEIDKAKKNGELLIEALIDGKRVQKTSQKIADKIDSVEFIRLSNKNGDLQIINVQDLNIHIFTSNDLKLLSLFILTNFAIQETRKEQNKLNKHQEKSKINGSHELDLLLRNLSKKNQKSELLDLDFPYETKKAKEKKRVIQKQIIIKMLNEMRMEENEKSKHEKNIELIKGDLIQFIKLKQLKKISNKISEENKYQISIIQLIKNLPIVN